MEKVCKYCGVKFNEKCQSPDTCYKCLKKLPLVRELKNIGRAIKEGTKK